MKKLGPKALVLVVVAVLVAGLVWRFAMGPSGGVAASNAVSGEVYVLPKEFLVNLADGRFAKLGVGLVLDEEEFVAALEESGEEDAAPEGFGDLPQEAVVRDVILDQLVEATDTDLIEGRRRARLKRSIRRALNRKTDVRVKDVLFTDLTVQ